MLSYFWNAANDYEPGYNVNSFWSLRNIKTVRKENTPGVDFVNQHDWGGER
jgi:hypothetical protein